jgi:putative ABC transport system permease protein
MLMANAAALRLEMQYMVFESFRIAFVALAANKLRAALTMLGIIIGVGAVVGMLAMGNGFQGFLNSQFDQLGIGTIYVAPFVDTNKIDRSTEPQLTYSDALALLEPGRAPLVGQVSVEYSGSAQVSANGKRQTYSIRAVTPSFFSITPQDLGAGRLLTQADEDERARVALLGKNVATNLFETFDSALGQRVILNGVSFEVVGVLSSEEGSVSVGSDPAESIFVPYQTGIARLYRSEISDKVDVFTISVKARDRNDVDALVTQVTQVLREEHRLTYQDNNFTVINPEQFAQQASAIIGGFNGFLGLVAGISLIVGGIGIMNIMLVSVTERTREIGLRKAVGARRFDILLQFLIEALVLCLVGSAFGVLLGYALSFVGTAILVGLFQAEGAEATVTIGNIALASGIAGAIGIFFGFFPALQASRLNPIEALRTE